MDQQLFNVVITIIGVLLTVIGTGALWWINTVWTSLKEQVKISSDLHTALQKQCMHLQEQISSLNIKLVEGYVPRHEIDSKYDRLFGVIDELRKEMSHLAKNQASVQALRDQLNSIQKRHQD